MKRWNLEGHVLGTMEELMNAAGAETELCKRQRVDEDEDAVITTSVDAVHGDETLQALLDAIAEPSIERLRAYAAMSTIDSLSIDSMQAHTELLLTSAVSSMTGCGGPVEGMQAPPAVVQGLVLICQEIVTLTSEAVSDGGPGER